MSIWTVIIEHTCQVLKLLDLLHDSDKPVLLLDAAPATQYKAILPLRPCTSVLPAGWLAGWLPGR